MFIQDNLSWINVKLACKCLGVKRSCYYDWVKNSEKRQMLKRKREKILTLIKQEHTNSKQRYGSIKIAKSLRNKGVTVNHKKIEKLMRENQIKSIVAKKYKATTNSNHGLPVFNNVLNREFESKKANHAWVGDITYIPTDEGWLYLATVIDLYSNKIIGYAMSERINKGLVIDALNMALKARNYPTNVIVHSDRGSQYASNAYRNLINRHNLIGSMSRKGNCWDNAVAENFFSIIKKEYISKVKFTSRNQAKLGIFDYIEGWYNSQRIHSKIGYLSPNDFEDMNKDSRLIASNQAVQSNIRVGAGNPC